MSPKQYSMGNGYILGEKWRKVAKNRRYWGHGEKSKNIYNSLGPKYFNSQTHLDLLSQLLILAKSNRTNNVIDYSRYHCGPR